MLNVHFSADQGGHDAIRWFVVVSERDDVAELDPLPCGSLLAVSYRGHCEGWGDMTKGRAGRQLCQWVGECEVCEARGSAKGGAQCVDDWTNCYKVCLPVLRSSSFLAPACAPFAVSLPALSYTLCSKSRDTPARQG